MNKLILADKYSKLVGFDKERFKSDVKEVTNKLNKVNVPDISMIYSKGKRDAIFYSICIRLALRSNRLLDYTVVTGQTFMNQHFLNGERDMELYDSVMYGDITFISLSQADYTGEFLESLLIDLVEFRKGLQKPTFIIYDTIDDDYMIRTKKLKEHFDNSYYGSINLNSISVFDTQTSKKPELDKPKKTAQNRRIL